jgi:hypothetical protein
MPTASSLRRILSAAIALFAGVVSSQTNDWPELPAKAFLSGRPATQVDVNEGRAVFVLMAGGIPISKPIAIAIPQFALLNGENGKPPTPVVVVQAEEFPKGKLVGVRDVMGKEYVVNLSDLQLLGTSKPRPEQRL